MRLGGLKEPGWRIVVGVAEDVPLGNPLSRDRSKLAVYVPLVQRDLRGAALVFRHRGNASGAVATVHRVLGSATDGGIVRLLLGQGGRQLGIGAAIALPLLVAIGIAFSRFFPIGAALAVTTGVLVATTIVAVVLAATYLPTRRALSVSPRQALWSD